MAEGSTRSLKFECFRMPSEMEVLMVNFYQLTKLDLHHASLKKYIHFYNKSLLALNINFSLKKESIQYLLRFTI